MSRYERYYEFMEKYEKFCEKVKEAEKIKYEALLSNKLSEIETVLSSYQSYIREMQNYEEKRKELCEELGFRSDRFCDIAEEFYGEERIQLTLQKNRFEILIENISYLNKKSVEVAEIQLKYAEELAQHHPENSRCYDAKGKTDSPLKNSNILNKMI